MSKKIISLILLIGAIIMFLPYWFMLVVSLETIEEASSVPPHLFPLNPIINNYKEIFVKLDFGRYFLNSLFVTLALVFSQIFLCSLAGYAFARLYFPFKNAIFLIFLSVIMLPGIVLLIPRYIILKNLGFVNTLTGVILLEIFSEFGIFLYRQHFLSLPIELEEAAIVDGASIWRILWNIMMPLSKPITLSFGLLVFIYAWNLFLWPLIVITSPEKRTLPIAIALLQGQYFSNWGVIMAGGVIASLPPIILFLFTQKSFIEGIAFSGLK
uniref:Carbohydrate ABC transporter permease n=1 Tax=Dictyoglomus turgidum TaxID=513050 RepID=A0A7C3WX13_9BACT